MKIIREMPVIKIMSVFCCLNYEHIKNMQILGVCPWCWKLENTAVSVVKASMMSVLPTRMIADISVLRTL